MTAVAQPHIWFLNALCILKRLILQLAGNDCFWCSLGLASVIPTSCPPQKNELCYLDGCRHMRTPLSLHGQTRSIALQGICGSACFSFQSCQFPGRFELQKKKLA